MFKKNKVAIKKEKFAGPQRINILKVKMIMYNNYPFLFMKYFITLTGEIYDAQQSYYYIIPTKIYQCKCNK